MNTKVVDINRYRKTKHHAVNNRALSNDDTFENYVMIQQRFTRDYDLFHSNMKTRNHKFMFPTVLVNYRRGINPVFALYYSTQESIFKHHQKKMYDWILGLFDDTDWYNDLIHAIKEDIAGIVTFCKKYNGINSEYIQTKLKELSVLKDKLKHFIEAFASLIDWKKDNC